ncbi:MAG: NrfD/PsrC family molybdoenzyme membrane anchor subunit [Nocardioidaceae bacterium]
MSESAVTREGVQNQVPGREAVSDYSTQRKRPGKRRSGKGEQPTVPDADFKSYYGRPVLNSPTWEEPDIPGYLFLGGLAGAASAMAAAADLRGEHALSQASKVGAASAAALSLVALVHDLGRPSRFLNMLRVFKVTSPMSVGSWLLSAYAPAAMVAAASSVTGRLRPLGALGTAAAAALGPGVASYTAALISDTAVPAWHDGYREMPFVFVGSGAVAAGGLGLVAAPRAQQGLPRRVAVLGAAGEVVASQLMERRMGMVAEPYKQGRSGTRMRLGQGLTAAGLAFAVLGRRNRVLSALGGGVLVLASGFTRFGIFEAGMASAKDPKYTVVPQRERLAQH